MKATEKKCPRCAEIIKAEALVCKHCSHEFSEAELALEREKVAKRKAARALDAALRKANFADDNDELEGHILSSRDSVTIARRLKIDTAAVVARGEALGMLFVEDEDDQEVVVPTAAATRRPTAPAEHRNLDKATANRGRTLECTLCSTAGIRWGASICPGCGANIPYPYVSSNDGDVKVGAWAGGILGFVFSAALLILFAEFFSEAGFVGIALLLTLGGAALGAVFVYRRADSYGVTIPRFTQPKSGPFVGVVIGGGD